MPRAPKDNLPAPPPPPPMTVEAAKGTANPPPDHGHQPPVSVPRQERRTVPPPVVAPTMRMYMRMTAEPFDGATHLNVSCGLHTGRIAAGIRFNPHSVTDLELNELSNEQIEELVSDQYLPTMFKGWVPEGYEPE